MIKKTIINLLTNTSIGRKIYESPKALEFFKSSFWSILGAIFSKGLIFISWVIVARILGSEGYGQFGILRSTVLMFTSFAGYSLGITASKHIAEFSSIDKLKAGRVLGLTIYFGVFMGLIVGFIFYLLAPWLASETLNAPEITEELKVGALILFFSSLNGAQIGALQGFGAFKRIAKINSIQAIISFPMFIIGALYFGIYGTVWAFALSYVVICALSYFSVANEAKTLSIKVDITNGWQEKQLLLTYSLPAFLSGLMVTPIKWYVDSILVSLGSFSELGLFTATLTFNNIILIGVGMLSGPFLSIMAKNKSDSKNSRFSRFNIIVPWALGIFITGPFIVFPEIGSLIFGDSFSGDKFEQPFIYVLLFTIIMMFKQGLGRVMAVYNLQWWSLISNFLWGISLVVCFLNFERKTALTLSISYLIAYIVNVIVVLPVYYKKNIIPDKTIESKEAFGVWFLIFVISAVGLHLNSYVLRLIVYIVTLLMFWFLFKRLFERKIEQ